jgi:hypothetical protein
MEKDCKMIFSNGQPVYEFRSRDLDIALKWAKENNAPVQAIKTPWGVLSLLDEETFETVNSIFND